MASNEVEVLDPAPTVEKLKKFASERVLNRRHFIAALGVAGAAAAGTELVRQGPTALAQQPKPNGYAQGDVLNFLLNINYLKATLYSFITQGVDLPTATFTNLGSGGVFNPPKQITFTAAGPASASEITDLFNALYYDEVNQLIALRTLVGSAVAARPSMNLAGTGTTTVTATQTVTPIQAIGLMRMLVDLSASAYAGATVYLTGTNLAYVTQALAAIGSHAGALRLIAIQAGAPYVTGQTLTTTGPTTQSQNSFTGSLVAGSTTIYNFAPTNPITAGSIISGLNVPVNTIVTAVNPPTVYTGTLSGTTTTPNNIVTNVAPLTGLVTGMALSGSGIPANAIITNITGSTITLGVVTGYSTLAPYTPITNGVTSVTGASPAGTAIGMTPGTYPLAFAGGGGSGAAGTITVLTAGTTTTAGTYNITLTASGKDYVTAPVVTAGTGGAPPVLTATVPAQITTTSATVTLTPGFTAATNKNTTLSLVSQTAGLIPGQMLTGTGVPASGFIAQSGINGAAGTITISSAASVTSSVAPTGFVTAGSAVITQVSSTSGVLFGVPISGTGIPAGATVAAIGSDQSGPNITFATTPPSTATVTTTGTSSVTPTAYLTSGSSVITALSSLSGLAPGSTVTGTGIPANTVIGSVGATNTATLAKAGTTPPFSVPQNATATSTLTLVTNKLTTLLQSGNNLLTVSSTATPLTPTSGLANGQYITDDQGLIPPGTTITAVTASSNTITLSAPATGATTVSTLATFTGNVVVSFQTISSVVPSSVLTSSLVGQPIAGTNIPLGTFVTAVNASAATLTISQFPTAAAGPEILGDPLTVTTSSTLTSSTPPKITVVSPTLSEPVTMPTIVTVTPSLGTATLSQAPTATGTATLIVQTADPMDVDPVDPGTAALASAGPAALAGTSPSVYAGFFNTAGGSTATATNPAGSVFARTFSQVLADLYGSTASQTFEGGFFPVGVAGGINFV